MEIIKIKNEIEEMRKKLDTMTLNNIILYQNQDLIKLSQELDILINKYIYMTTSI
ncbi:aspartyl-phosphate phosphatase Spo0E family protein [Tepidibacter aestuarii]|uniref:aspartyl-phosphate phosphatase Spo0E family protein n=1 Tax=Tepidibacter aestuarii TaxID=2925782 RepID=UPI0020C16A41|nr:aspartyl-phosphate phosphatase Spo0E family protein [Tepidibacter aestuarii]CAH2213240.1 Sporulation stage 0, Spo0E-like regulatory phosphatase [Tepidibacter aestuarii]